MCPSSFEVSLRFRNVHTLGSVPPSFRPAFSDARADIRSVLQEEGRPYGYHHES